MKSPEFHGDINEYCNKYAVDQNRSSLDLKKMVGQDIFPQFHGRVRVNDAIQALAWTSMMELMCLISRA